MKKTITILPLLLFCFCFSYSQRQNVTLHLLKEDEDVDSLMNIVVKDNNSQNICFSFTTISLPHGYGFLVLRLTKTRYDLYHRALPPDNIRDYGYFEFRGYTVFVSADRIPAVFFSRTALVKIFSTIALKDPIYLKQDTSFIKEDQDHRTGIYRFTDSNFKNKPQIASLSSWLH
jgi:hypothetical protein